MEPERQNDKQVLQRSANGINYDFEIEPDGWISIYEVNDGIPRRPVVQACSLEKAEEFIDRRMTVGFPMARLC